MNRTGSMLITALVLLLLFTAAGWTPASAAQEAASPEQQLTERYVPIAYLREQERACAMPPDGGEPYLPLPVEIILDNDRVLIRDRLNNDEVLATGPNAAELATFPRGTYMDFPGDPRRPGCTFETDERARISELGLEPTTYARVVLDDEGQRLVLQYWFYWYFNDWNNTHESDWEMIQLMWDDVSGVDAALAVPPDRIGYSQHGNGEMADWRDDKVEVEDNTHPLVYPAAGSHATFFSNETFLAWGERNSGFGCDVSSAPSVRVPLDAVLVPDEIDPEGDFAWLLYEGRWGERQPSSFNGPWGPALNSRWIDPWEASDNWRPFSIVVPGSNTLGPTMTEVFCSATAAGSRVLLLALVNPWVTLTVVAAVIGVLISFFRRSLPTLRRATSLYREHWTLFVGIGLLAIPIGIIFNGIQAFLVERQPLSFVIQWFDSTAGARLTAVSTIGGLQQLAMLLIIAPAIVQGVVDIYSGERTDILRCYRLAAARIPAIALSFLILIVLAGIPLLFVIGFPISLWLVVRWHFFLHVLMMDPQQSSWEALQTSARLVRHRWWKTLFSVFLFDLVATIPGILVGFGLLTLGRTAVGFANGASGLLYALTIPLAVIAVTLIYLDRARETGEAPGRTLPQVPPRREDDLHATGDEAPGTVSS